MTKQTVGTGKFASLASLRPHFTLAVLGIGIALTQSSVNADDEEVTMPAPENHTLETKDGVELRCTYYAGGVVPDGDGFRRIDGKKVVPIIMLPGWGGGRGEYSWLASMLQNQGHAVLLVDPRGHGGSKRVKGVDEEIDLEKISKLGVIAMLQDIETAKKFLMDQNNLGKLNIEMLCVVAADANAVVAVSWALRDWSYPQLINRKQGQDVKALILLSPQKSIKGVSLDPLLRNPLLSGRGAAYVFPLMIIVGNNDRSAIADARGLHNSLEKTRPKLPRTLSKEEQLEQQTLFLIEKDTQLQGTKLVDPRLKLGTENEIAGFLAFKILKHSDEFAWQERKD